MDYLWIDEPQPLAEFCNEIESGTVIAVDTESDHFFAYRPFVALIQLATPDQTVLIDPLALEPDEMKPLLRLVEDPAMITIMHSCRNDIRELDRDWGVDPKNIFDTQLAARFLRYERSSLDWLLTHLRGVKLEKKYQRFDWTKRPLPEGALQYAAGDVIYLFDLRERLLRELQAERWLAPFQQYSEWVVTQSGHEEKPFDPEDWRSKKTRDLDERGRAAYAEMYVWRHALCERLNRAAIHVFPDHAMVKVANQRPTSLDQLRSIRGVPDPLVRHDGEELLDVLRASESAEPPPARRPRDRGPRAPRDEVDRRDALKQMRREVADELGMPAHIVLDKGVFAEIARLNPSELDELDDVDGFLPWQRELLGERILEICAG